MSNDPKIKRPIQNIKLYNMKKIIALIPALLLVIGVSAQGKFEVSSNTCNFGTVKKGKSGTCTVTFTNIGEAKANMGAIRPASENISTDWETKVLDPGKSDSFQLTVFTDGEPVGPFKKSMTLIFDRAGDPLTVWVKGTIE
jgi:hypothetical protein